MSWLLGIVNYCRLMGPMESELRVAPIQPEPFLDPRSVCPTCMLGNPSHSSLMGIVGRKSFISIE